MKSKLLMVCMAVSLCLASVSSPPMAVAQGNPATAFGSSSLPSGVHKMLTRFFSLVQVREVDLAFSELMENSPLLRDSSNIRSLHTNVKKSFELYGNMSGVEYLPTDEVTPSFIKVRVLAKHERYPIRWQFTMYNSPTMGWIVTDIKLDDESEYLFPIPGFER